MKWIYPAIILVIVTSGIILAQEPVVLTLGKSVELALQHNLSVIQTQNNVDAAKSRVLAAYGNYLPTISASAGWGRDQTQTPESIIPTLGGYRWVNNGGTDSFYAPTSIDMRNVGGKQLSSSYSTGLNLSYTLFDGFRREANLNSSIATSNSTKQTAIRTKQTIINSVEASYLNVLRKEQLVKVRQENLKRDKQQLERIIELNRIGALSMADVYRQQSQVAADELDVITYQNDYDNAKADLIALIGLEMDREFQFTDPSISTAIDQSELDASSKKFVDYGHLVQRALVARSDYLAVKESYKVADANVTEARSGYFPRISASAGYGLSSSEFSNLSDNKRISWGISLSWSIFDAFQTNQALQSAIVSRKNSDTNLKQAEREIAVDVKKALLSLEAARKGVEVSQKGVQSATEDRKIAEERYNLGAGTLLDLQTANLGLVTAEANKINSSFAYIIAKRNLEYVIGERTN